MRHVVIERRLAFFVAHGLKLQDAVKRTLPVVLTHTVYGTACIFLLVVDLL